MMLDQILSPIRADLAAVEAVILTSCETQIATITQVVQHIIANGGKRIRPALTLLTASLCGYTGDTAPRVAAAMEMLHTASLLHDDVIDNASSRRGTVSANHLWGNQVSVLVGDFLWCKACQLIVDQGSIRILRAIIDAVIGTTEGEVLELTRSNDLDLTETEYLTIIQHKTAMLMAVAARAGAMLGETNEALELACARFGLDLGMAFQLADDTLDYTCDEARTGKAQGTDLREGRLTLPLLLAMQRCGTAEQAIIRQAILAPALSPEQFARVVAILEHYQAIADSRRRAKAFATAAVTHVAHLVPSATHTAMVQLADYIVTRDT